MTVDEEKWTEFNIELVKEYNESNEIKKMLKENVKRIEHNTSNNDFIKIGFRPQLEREILEVETGGVRTHPYVLGFGRVIALGEIKYFVKELERIDVETESVEKDKLKPKNIIEHLKSNQNKMIVSSEDIFDFTMTREWGKYFDFGFGLDDLKFYKKPLHTISSKTLGHAIYIINISDLDWTYKEFYNEYSKEKETIFISKNEDNRETVDVLFYSLVKFLIVRTEEIHKIQLV